VLSPNQIAPKTYARPEKQVQSAGFLLYLCIINSMALLYAVAGAVSGKKGRILLQWACQYFDQVRIRTGHEEQPTKDWSRLQLAVLNNQACISNELCMHNQTEEQLNEMRHLLRVASRVLDNDVFNEFSLNLQFMLGGKLAAAAQGDTIGLKLLVPSAKDLITCYQNREPF
jgi:hypothetical protein